MAVLGCKVESGFAFGTEDVQVCTCLYQKLDQKLDGVSVTIFRCLRELVSLIFKFL